MNFHTIHHEGVAYAGPPEYAREDQAQAAVLFKDVADANTMHPGNVVGMVDYLLNLMPQPSGRTPYFEAEMKRHLERLVRQFRAAWSARTRALSGEQPPTPPPVITEPTPIPEQLIPGQRKEMVDPTTGELITVIVPAEQTNTAEPTKVDTVAVLINAALSYCYRTQQENNQIIQSVARLALVVDAKRREREQRADSRRRSNENILLGKCSEVMALAAAARPKYDEDTTVEEILRGEKIDIKSFGLNYRKLREILARIEQPTGAIA